MMGFGDIRQDSLYHYKELAWNIGQHPEVVRKFLVEQGVKPMCGELLISGKQFLELWERRAEEKEPRTANEMMSELLKANPEAGDWTAEQFAKAIGRAAGTVKDTAVWKGLMSLRASRKRDRRRPEAR